MSLSFFLPTCPVIKSQTPMQLLVTTTAIPADVEMLQINVKNEIQTLNLIESMVRLCLSMCRSFSKMWSRSQILMLRSMEEVMTQLSVPTTRDLISTILWKEKECHAKKNKTRTN